MGLENTNAQLAQNTEPDKQIIKDKQKNPGGLIRMLTNLIAADEEVK